MISHWKYWKWDFSLPYWLPESQCAQRVFHLLVYFAMDDGDVKRRKVTRECIICREDKGFRAFPGRITEACQHVRDICRSCMKQTIKTEIQSKGQSAAIRCPNCAAELSLADVARESSTADAEQLDTFLLQKALSQEPNFVWCAHGCGIGQLVDDLSCNTFMTCQSCGRRDLQPSQDHLAWRVVLCWTWPELAVETGMAAFLQTGQLHPEILFSWNPLQEVRFNAGHNQRLCAMGNNGAWVAIQRQMDSCGRVLPTHSFAQCSCHSAIGRNLSGRVRAKWQSTTSLDALYCRGVKQHEAVVSFYVLSILNNYSYNVYNITIHNIRIHNHTYARRSLTVVAIELSMR